MEQDVQEKINKLVAYRLERVTQVSELKEEIKGLNDAKKTLERELEVADRELKILMREVQ